MLGLLDLGLFVVDPARWSTDRAGCRAPMAAMAIHADALRRHPVRVLWSESFFSGFPWNQPRCPSDLRDLCVLVDQLLHVLRGNQRLLQPESPPGDLPRLSPDLFDAGCPAELREAWLRLLPAAGEEPLAVATWTRAALAGAREIAVVRGVETRSASLVCDGDDWRAFVDHHHRPDLRGRRVAVLGGSRAPFERARQKLAAYGLDDCRRLPPAYEENRTKQETKRRLENVDLVVVCTNRMKHTDTDQLSSVKDELTCAIVMIDADTDARIEKAVVDHFRGANASG